MIDDHRRSEEITRQTYAEVWGTASRYRAERGSPTAWVLRIAHRLAVADMRSQQHERIQPIADDFADAQESRRQGENVTREHEITAGVVLADSATSGEEGSLPELLPCHDISADRSGRRHPGGSGEIEHQNSPTGGPPSLRQNLVPPYVALTKPEWELPYGKPSGSCQDNSRFS